MTKKKPADPPPSVPEELAVTAIEGQPETAFDMVNKYGTYNIQPTAESGNLFPTIAQGLPEEEQDKSVDKPQKERKTPGAL